MTLDLFRMLKAAYESKHAAQVSFMATLNEKGKSPERMSISLRLLSVLPLNNSASLARGARFFR